MIEDANVYLKLKLGYDNCKAFISFKGELPTYYKTIHEEAPPLPKRKETV